MTALVLDDVACVRRGRLVFEGVSLALGAGDAALVTGANGAGKSSLLRVTAGLLAPFAGMVRLDERIALLTEAAALDGERRLRDALGFWAVLDGAGAAAVDAALAAVDLAALAEAPVRILSTGQRRRAGLARVLASGAPVWLLDEPANGLDDASVARLVALVEAHRAAGGIAVVATHLPLALADAQEVRL